MTMREPTPAPPSCSHVALVAVVLASRPARCRSDVRCQHLGARAAGRPLGVVAILLAYGWGRGLLDVGAQALMRGLATAFPRCVRGCPYLTAGPRMRPDHPTPRRVPALAAPPPLRPHGGLPPPPAARATRA